METNQNPNSFMQSNTAKIIMVGVLTLVLLIPLQFVKSLIYERSARQKEVMTDINQKWGGNVFMYGPVIKVPYKVYTKSEEVDAVTKKVTYVNSHYTEFAYFFPEQLKMTANIKTESLTRSSYESAVFNSTLNFTGNYTTPNFAAGNISEDNVEWEKATLLVKTTNLKGINGIVNININGNNYSLEPVASENSKDTAVSLETRPVNLKNMLAGTPVAFKMAVSYKGSNMISIVPVGKETTAAITSNWNTPSFNGEFIPVTKTITDKGFTANWKISHLNRPFPQQHFGVLPDINKYTFNTEFVIPVDEYQQNDRASKYGFLVIGLTMLIFFLIQSMSKISIHIFQYGMIGLALIMFYTLLISITEHSTFNIAYLISALSVIIMIVLYSVSILKNVKFPMFIGASLGALYSFIYIIIQLEDYALLAGSIGIFLILGAIMYFSRKINWNSHEGY